MLTDELFICVRHLQEEKERNNSDGERVTKSEIVFFFCYYFFWDGIFYISFVFFTAIIG
jgi:hypothetical protein